MVEKRPYHENQVDTFNSILIIGAAGATGQLFANQFAKIPQLNVMGLIKPYQTEQLKRLPVANSAEIESISAKKPQAIIAATPNPTDEILESIATHLSVSTTVILPQNGVDVVPQAQQAFAGQPVNLIRASLFTTASQDENGHSIYNPTKLRIALAPVGKINEAFSVELLKSLQRSKELFTQAGFSVVTFDDYQAMEWTKLVVNGLGATGAITGLDVKATFADKDLAQLELRGLHERLNILQAANIQFLDIPWSKISLLPMLDKVHMSIKDRMLARKIIGGFIAKGRNNQPPAAARKIAAGRQTEVRYYHQPFVDKAHMLRMNATVDAAILTVMDEHLANHGIDLKRMSPEERREHLLYAST